MKFKFINLKSVLIFNFHQEFYEYGITLNLINFCFKEYNCSQIEKINMYLHISYPKQNNVMSENEYSIC